MKEISWTSGAGHPVHPIQSKQSCIKANVRRPPPSSSPCRQPISIIIAQTPQQYAYQANLLPRTYYRIFESKLNETISLNTLALTPLLKRFYRLYMSTSPKMNERMENLWKPRPWMAFVIQSIEGLGAKIFRVFNSWIYDVPLFYFDLWSFDRVWINPYSKSTKHLSTKTYT